MDLLHELYKYCWNFHLCWEDRQLIANMTDLFTATGHIHYLKSACLNLQTIALTYQNNIHCYISHLLKRLVIQYVLAVAIGPVYGLFLSQSRSLFNALMHTMNPCAEIDNVRANWKCK